jgi:hypothetical protein
MFKRIWTGDMIIRHIMSKSGSEPLNSHYYATTYSDVYAAAERLFGSWQYTIEACGFDYSKIKKYQTWSKERVVAEIKAAKANGTPLGSKYTQDNNKPLYMAAIKRYKNWNSALKRAGINPKRVRLRRLMTTDEVREEIQTLFRKNVDMAYPNMRKNHQYLLAAGMKKIGGGSWAEARRVCGIEVNYRIPRHKRETQDLPK